MYIVPYLNLVNYLLTQGTSKPPRPTPVPRAPLVKPVCGSCPSPYSYDQDLSKIWPTGIPAGQDFLQTDCWGVSIPDLPFVPGGSSASPLSQSRFLSWFFDRYPADLAQQWLVQCCLNGYNTVFRSAPDSMGPPSGSPPGNNLTLDQFVTSCLVNKAMVPYGAVFLSSKDFQPANMTPAQFQAYADPIIDALVAAQACDELIPGWEWDLWNVPGDSTIAIFQYVADRAHAAGMKMGVHYSTRVTTWQQDGEDRPTFWGKTPFVDYLEYQADSSWDPGQYQSNLMDTLKFGPGVAPKLRGFELLASWLFDGHPSGSPTPTEEDACAQGLIGASTFSGNGAVVYGSGSDIRNWDGTPVRSAGV